MEITGDMDEEEGEEGMLARTCRKFNINPNLIMLKVTLFVMYGATSSLVPFLTIHMQSVGLTIEDIALIYLTLPLTTFLAPPITGFLVDKFGHYKPVLFVSLAMNAIFHHSLLHIPHMETPGITPPAYVMRHPHHGKVEVWWSPCPSRECPLKEELNLIVDKCEDHCMLHANVTFFNVTKKLHPTKVEQSIAVRPPTLLNTPLPCYVYGSSTEGLDALNSASPKERELHFLVEKKLSKSNSTKSGKSPPNKKSNKEEETVFMVLDMHENLMTAVENFGMELSEDSAEEVTDFRQHFNSDMMVNAGVNFSALLDEDLRCGGRVVATNLTYRKLNELAADCMLQKCSFRAGGPQVCPPAYKESDDRVFWIYFVLRFIGTTMMSASVTVMDPIALTLIQRYGGEFGRERLFSTIGMAIFSPLTGVLIDYKSRQQGYTDFSYAFYMYDLLLGISIMTVLWMPVGAKLPVDNIVVDMLKLLRRFHIIAFIFFMFALGNLWGFIESYLFMYLKDLGATNYMLGITVSVATISSIPFLYGAEWITGRIGHVAVIVLAFFSHSIRLYGYYKIEEPWWVFPFEAMEAIAVHLMWVAAATYCAIIAPKNLLATLIGVLGMAHFSLGRGSGSFIGGHLIKEYGTRESFRIMSLSGFLMGSIYGLIYFIWLRHYNQNNDDKINNQSPSDEEIDKCGEDVEKGAKETREELAERLSLIIKFNHRGSLASLDGVARSRSTDFHLTPFHHPNSNYSNANPIVRVVAIDSCGNMIDLMKDGKDSLGNGLKSSIAANSLGVPQLPLFKSSDPQLSRIFKEYGESNLNRTCQCQKKSVKSLGEDLTISDSIPEEKLTANAYTQTPSFNGVVENGENGS